MIYWFAFISTVLFNKRYIIYMYMKATCRSSTYMYMYMYVLIHEHVRAFYCAEAYGKLRTIVMTSSWRTRTRRDVRQWRRFRRFTRWVSVVHSVAVTVLGVMVKLHLRCTCRAAVLCEAIECLVTSRAKTAVSWSVLPREAPVMTSPRLSVQCLVSHAACKKCWPHKRNQIVRVSMRVQCVYNSTSVER